MISRLEGILIQENGDRLIIAVSGIGFEVFIPSNQLNRLPPTGNTISLHTHLIWKETGPLLFGFFEKEDVDLYAHLTSVSGIGPRLALNLMGYLPRPELANAIIHEQVQILAKAPGLGKKTAQRLSIELKDKIVTLAQASQTNCATDKRNALGGTLGDALGALMNLGYSPAEAKKRIDMVNNLTPKDVSLDLSTLISQALKVSL